MNLKLPSIFVLLGLLSTLVVVPMTTYAQVQGPGQGQGAGAQNAPGQNKGNTFDVTGSGTSDKGAVDFTGKFVVSEFKEESGKVVAHGTLSGTLSGAGIDNPVDVPARDVAIPVKTIEGKSVGSSAVDSGEANDLTIAQAPSCNILHLVLGPLHLDLLGLVVDLNQVLLNITGQTGAGNLLGNLLCALTGILDSNPPLSAITQLLNAILAVLNLNL